MKRIGDINENSPCILEADRSLEAYAPRYDPFAYLVAPEAATRQKRLHAPLSLGVMFSNRCHSCPNLRECNLVYGLCFRDSFFHYGWIYGPPPKCPWAPPSPLRMS